MCLRELAPIFQIVSYVASAGAFLFAANTYYRNNKVKRGEWLKSLHEKFFESEIYKEVRREIDYERLGTFLSADENEIAKNESNEEKLVDFLNFFEFISILQNRSHIKKEEMDDLFGYYFGKIKENDFLKNYIAKNGFENLDKNIND